MNKFTKGAFFIMGGKEYEVLAEGTDDPASCLVYAPAHETEHADPLTIRMWKAEAKLARGDIMIRGHEENLGHATSFYPPIKDPLEQIAELKKRIQAIEERRVTLLKIDDPLGQVLLQDNIVRPNKAFDIWAYTLSSGIGRCHRNIQYIKTRGLIINLSANNAPTEHLLFNIGDQIQPCCSINGDNLSSEAKIKIELTPGLKTIQGGKTAILTPELKGKIGLTIEICVNCKYQTGMTMINANILQAAYLRDVKSPVLKIDNLAFPEIGDHAVAIEGICVDIYTEGLNQ